MSTKHFSISQASLLASVSQLVSFGVGFGLINSTEKGVLIAAASAVVNAAFLVANAVHAFADAPNKVVYQAPPTSTAVNQIISPTNP